jgi:protein SCO1/2
MKIFILVLILAVASVVFVNNYTSKQAEQIIVEPQEAQGKALIGGKFELVDQNGKKFSNESLNGKYSVIFFGFTNCPMICPTAVNSISAALQDIDPKAEKFQPIFITTDPERDDVARLKEYFDALNPNFIALTGSVEALSEAKNAYKVYAKKIDNGRESYDMDHSSIIYIMDKNGEFLKHFTHNSKPEEMAEFFKSLD